MLTTLSRPFVISEPRLGLLNLGGAAMAPYTEADAQALAPLFSSTARSTDGVPECDVLFVYANIAHDGSVIDSNYTLERIVAMSGASIAIVAAANAVDSYIAAASWLKPPKGVDTPSANLVMTLDRRDPLFARFFAQLFTQMKQGVTMPMAWVTLAPQAPKAEPEAPDNICAMDAGHVAFAHRPSFWRRLFER